jgi:hypothetical protein
VKQQDRAVLRGERQVVVGGRRPGDQPQRQVAERALGVRALEEDDVAGPLAGRGLEPRPPGIDPGVVAAAQEGERRGVGAAGLTGDRGPARDLVGILAGRRVSSVDVEQQDAVVPRALGWRAAVVPDHCPAVRAAGVGVDLPAAVVCGGIHARRLGAAPYDDHLQVGDRGVVRGRLVAVQVLE